MIRQLLNWRIGLALIAVAIVIGTVFYSNFLAKKIANEEREKLSQWIEANKFIGNAPDNIDLTLASQIQQQNADIPIIQTNEKDSIIDSRNLDSVAMASSPDYLRRKLKEFKSSHPPVELVLSKKPYIADKYYYGDSALLKQVRYYPLIQLLIVALFIFITLFAITTRNKSTQNQVWAGMAKETAHQLGTPISSLQGWVEMLKENPDNSKIVPELEKDVSRLQLVSDRFGKIGSSPQLEKHNIISQVTSMIDYMKKRAPGKVNFSVNTNNEKEIFASISPPLFDWVIENLLKNSLDAMEGTGEIKINIENLPDKVYIDLKDTGKGIPLAMQQKVFKPGFTTKKRGWGLGLSLSKRIIEQYHKGEIFIKNSEPGKGTTFRIVLKK